MLRRFQKYQPIFRISLKIIANNRNYHYLKQIASIVVIHIVKIVLTHARIPEIDVQWPITGFYASNMLH